jgi:isoleucyl-tRNA synthetase
MVSTIDMEDFDSFCRGRLYLINSPVVRAENLRFKEDGVRDILKDVFLPWYNAYRFFAQQKELFEKVLG